MKKKSKIGLLYVSFIFLLLISCKKNNPYPNTGNGSSSSFSDVFSIFWKGMNENYLYWDIDTTNWDRVYEQFSPVFKKLNLQNDTDIKKSVGYFRQMTYGLIDSHCNITFDSNVIADSVVFPSFDRKVKNPGYHNPYSYAKIDSTYLDPGFYAGFDSINTINQSPLFSLCGTIRNEVLYFSCNEFSLFTSYNSPNQNSVQNTLNYFFSMLNHMPSNIKELILDFRDNPGGELSDLNFVIGRFITTPLHFGYTRYKSGTGRLDYTPWLNAYVNPEPGSQALQIPIVVLADNFSASLTEIIVMAIHSLKNGIFIGETTWGATGLITSTDIYNDGPFSISGFMSVNISSAEFKNIDNKIYEGIGFPPDLNVPFDISALNAGDDPQLDSAINHIQ
jgi:carboxyl-terminal processing protease